MQSKLIALNLLSIQV